MQTPFSGGISTIRTWFHPYNAWRLNILFLGGLEKVEGVWEIFENCGKKWEKCGINKCII
jgi:hypothetical protein